MATNLFYVYIHKKISNDEVFYVGKGFGKRAWKKTSRSEYWKRIENKYGRYVEIVKDGLQEDEAFELEKEIISYYGRKNLCNLNDGGYGGKNPSQETREKMRQAFLGRKFSPETIEKKRIASTGKKHTEETKAKLSAYFKGKKLKPHTEEAKEKIRQAHLGRIVSEETRKKLSEAQKGKTGRKLTDQEKENLRKVNIGKIVSKETRQKIGDANRGRKHTQESLEKIKISNKIKNEKMKKKRYCSNGMVFDSSLDAEIWLRNNGFPTASRSNISSCCNGKLKTAYGLKWGYNLTL